SMGGHKGLEFGHVFQLKAFASYFGLRIRYSVAAGPRAARQYAIRNAPYVSQFGRDLLQRVAFNRVPHLKIIEAVNADAAFHAGAHLIDFVLETAQGLHHAFVNQPLAAHHADFAADDASAADDAAGHFSALGQLENLPHLGRADDVFLEDRFQQTGHGFLHLVDQFVDDGVELDLDPFALGHI